MPQAAGLYYETHGAADAPALIFSSGLGGTGSYWAPNLAPFAHHYRVIVYDHRGTGRSERALPDTVRIQDLADDMLKLMDALAIQRAHIVGHALGGCAGLLVAIQAPERVGKLVVVNGWVRPEAHMARCFDARLHILRSGGERAWIAAQPIFLYPAAWDAEHGGRIDLEAEAQLASFQGVANLEKRIAAIRAFDLGGDSNDVMLNLGLPMLALAARDDVLVPWTESERMASGAHQVTVELMQTGGHACNVAEPAEFNRIVLQWLSR